MWKGVLETYQCLILAKKEMREDVSRLEQEYAFLLMMAKDSGHIEDDTGLRGQFGGHRE